MTIPRPSQVPRRLQPRRRLLRAAGLVVLLLGVTFALPSLPGRAHVQLAAGGHRGGQIEVEAASLGFAVARGLTVIVGAQIGAKFAKEVYKQANAVVESWVSELASSRLAHSEVLNVPVAPQTPLRARAETSQKAPVVALLAQAIACMLALWAVRSAVVFAEKSRTRLLAAHECPCLGCSPSSSPRLPTPPVWTPLR
mmetsp:Transcript_137435/g.342834  ORF Transcript_137435/g.342834 Transcript_137435/m.342834 type:complete len:197 (-) Transcript_137435:203-793(-)